jgi:hypothetical protein
MVLHVSHQSLPSGRIEGFHPIWAFYVTGLVPDKHCQFCFKGARAKNFNSTNAASGVDIVLDRLDISPVVYVCGVAKGPVDQRKHHNLHLPVHHKPGATVTIGTYDGYQLTVSNAEQLDIPALPDGWNGLPLKHTRCKNFRFALSYFGSTER